MTGPQATGPVVLVILDGWGIGPAYDGNAVIAAETPTMDRLLASYPNATLRTSGEDVGLPAGQMGNSEVGHLNIGAGFVVYQWLTRLELAIRDRTFFANPALTGAVDAARAKGTTLHLIGLVSDGGVHSHISHLRALIEMARERGLPGERVVVHAITDGRDTPPSSGQGFVGQLDAMLATIGGRVGTVGGRYYAMDRDRRWDRVRLAFDAVVHGSGIPAASASAAVEASYAGGTTDEFIEPRVVAGYDGISDGDEVVWFNFRSDRARQLTQALAEPDFAAFERGAYHPVGVTTLTRYGQGLPVTVAYEEDDIAKPLATAISDTGLRQFHTAETEKYPHVTYFLNGGREEPFPGEDRRLVPSPKVATYDLQPEMSAAGVTDGVVAAVETGRYAVVVVNYANGDMVGHTGVFGAAVKAVETVDACLGRVVEATLARGGALLVTADHGNAEEMIDRATGGPMTTHTTNPVPVVLVTPEGHPSRAASLRPDGVLSAIAPTILDLLGIERPAAMTQESLIVS